MSLISSAIFSATKSRDIQSTPGTAHCKRIGRFQWNLLKTFESDCNRSYTVYLNAHLAFFRYTLYLQIVFLLSCSVKITLMGKTQ